MALLGIFKPFDIFFHKSAIFAFENVTYPFLRCIVSKYGDPHRSQGLFQNTNLDIVGKFSRSLYHLNEAVVVSHVKVLNLFSSRH